MGCMIRAKLEVNTARLKKLVLLAEVSTASRVSTASTNCWRSLQKALGTNLDMRVLVHNTFHVSNLKKCYSDEPLAVPLEGLHVDDKLYLVEEPVEIMDREVKRLKQSRILIVKVRWNLRRGPEFTWEREDQFQKKYSHLFTKPVPSSTKLEVKTVRLKKLVLLAEVSTANRVNTASRRPEEDPADHPIDGGDNDDNESSNDDDDDDDVVKDTKAFETDESFF
ncbi:hypothetical protein Tco_1212731 [Tanacetum coccineum]